MGWLLGSLVAPLGLARAQCAPVGSPYIEQTDFAPVERYLARGIAMHGLVEERLNARVPAGSLPPTAYRPEHWEPDIRLLADLRAAYIHDAAGMWDHPDYFITQPAPSPYLVAAKATVDRINAAYDCAGLRRPIIGAAVFENIDPGPVCAAGSACPPGQQPGPLGTNSSVRLVPIPAAIIEEFRREFSPAEAAYYLDAAGRPKTSLFFTYDRLASPFFDFYTPDIRKTEGKLWVFHQAKAYLDAGFTSLHMGQPKAWAGLSETQEDAAARLLKMKALRDFMRHIRHYAARRAPTTALLLTAEPQMDVGAADPVKFSIKEQGVDSLIFDFEMATARVREIGAGSVQPRANTTASCPYEEPPAHLLDGCGATQGTLDPCNGVNYLPNGGGTTPLGKTYAVKSPYIVWLDHGPTTYVVPPGVSGKEGTWGWDDAAWFTAGLPSAECRARWLAYEATRARSFVPSKSFLLLPGILYNSGTLVKNYRLANEPAVVAAIKDLWAVRTPHLTATPQPCAGADLAVGAAAQLPSLRLQLLDTDVSSLYTWHIKGPSGYAPAAAGTDQLFSPAAPGTYTITVRQDNLGLPATGRTRYGSRTFQATVVVAANCEVSVLTVAPGPGPAPRVGQPAKATGHAGSATSRPGSRPATTERPTLRPAGQPASSQLLRKLAATGNQSIAWQ